MVNGLGLSPGDQGSLLALPFPFRSRYAVAMLSTWIEDVIGRLKQLGFHADGLEDENRRLQAELSSLLAARRDNDDTFTVRQWDRDGN
jgi:hypothetical protein